MTPDRGRHPAAAPADLDVNPGKRTPAKARKDHYDYALTRWSSIERRVPITDESREQLCRYRKESGVSAYALLRDAGKLREGLIASKLKAWINGRAKIAWESHLEFVLARRKERAGED